MWRRRARPVAAPVGRLHRGRHVVTQPGTDPGGALPGTRTVGRARAPPRRGSRRRHQGEVTAPPDAPPDASADASADAAGRGGRRRPVDEVTERARSTRDHEHHRAVDRGGEQPGRDRVAEELDHHRHRTLTDPERPRGGREHGDERGDGRDHEVHTDRRVDAEDVNATAKRTRQRNTRLHGVDHQHLKRVRRAGDVVVLHRGMSSLLCRSRLRAARPRSC